MRRPDTKPTDVRYCVAGGLVAMAMAGCGSSARVQLSAAQTLDTLTDSVRLAVDELHRDVITADRRRRADAIDAFVRRIQRDHADPAQTSTHVDAFHQALDRLRADTEIEFTRHLATVDNLRAIKEIAAGLRELGIQSMSLDDEVRRYITDVFQNPQPEPSENGS